MCQILESTSVRQWRDRTLWCLHRGAVGGTDPQNPELGLHGNRCAVQLAYSTVQWSPNARDSDRDPAADDGPLPGTYPPRLNGLLVAWRLYRHLRSLLCCV